MYTNINTLPSHIHIDTYTLRVYVQVCLPTTKVCLTHPPGNLFMCVPYKRTVNERREIQSRRTKGPHARKSEIYIIRYIPGFLAGCRALRPTRSLHPRGQGHSSVSANASLQRLIDVSQHTSYPFRCGAELRSSPHRTHHVSRTWRWDRTLESPISNMSLPHSCPASDEPAGTDTRRVIDSVFGSPS